MCLASILARGDEAIMISLGQPKTKLEDHIQTFFFCRNLYPLSLQTFELLLDLPLIIHSANSEYKAKETFWDKEDLEKIFFKAIEVIICQSMRR